MSANFPDRNENILKKNVCPPSGYQAILKNWNSPHKNLILGEVTG